MDYNRLFSSRVLDIKPSGIRRFFNIASEMEDVVSLGVGEPDFKTPWLIRRAGIESLERGRTWYTANAGLFELKTEISRYLKRRLGLEYAATDELFVTVGGSEAIDMCIRAFVNPGDEVLVVQPSFVCYAPISAMQGAKVVPIATKAEDRFRLNADALRAAITPKTKLLILPFPSNPTGAVMEKEDLEAVAQVLRGTDIMVLSDEIYAELTYSGKHASLAHIPDMRERTVVVSGFSKAYAMTGWRLGYVCGPAPVIEQMLKIHQFAVMCAPTMSQFAAIEAMRSCDEDIDAMRAEYDTRRRLLVDGLNRIGLDCFEPQGAFYVFPSIRSTGLTSEQFCEKLLYGKRVAVIPGDAFGECGEWHVRISYSYSLEHLMEAVKRMEQFLAELRA
jgi:aminotransferase